MNDLLNFFPVIYFSLLLVNILGHRSRLLNIINNFIRNINISFNWYLFIDNIVNVFSSLHWILFLSFNRDSP